MIIVENHLTNTNILSLYVLEIVMRNTTPHTVLLVRMILRELMLV